MNLVTYNLRAGGTGRSHWVRILDAFRPDLFLVQESAHPDEHLPPMLYPEAAGRYAWTRAEGKGRRWGSAIYSARGDLQPLTLPDFQGLVVGAEITRGEWPDGSQQPLKVFSIHAPERPYYHVAVNAILDMIADCAGDSDVVIGGDFNLTITAQHDTEPPTIKGYDLAIHRRLEDEFGLVNCWRAANPTLPLAQTLRWSNAPTTIYHCDALFVPRSWAGQLLTCEIIASPEWDRLSDHNPIVARFGAG